MPSALPYVVTGLRLAIGRALIGVIVAEVYTAIAGLRNLIVTNANSFRTDRTFVPILLISLLGTTPAALARMGRAHKSCGGQQRTDPCDDPQDVFVPRSPPSPWRARSPDAGHSATPRPRAAASRGPRGRRSGWASRPGSPASPTPTSPWRSRRVSSPRSA
ncbi:hypothetical protein K1T35_29780 [Pseudonocardia sp. DSM 110487]|nr:hypothetical protein K1T35_29780 [Pseudonocardia sp. DSM 110487]